jgi:hypothetical protein
MRKTRVLLCALLALVAGKTLAADCTWATISGAERSVQATGAANCTFTVATATATAGMNMVGVGGFSVEVCADSGQTITTSFALSAYTYSTYGLLWMPAPGYNLPAPSDGTGDRCQQIGGFIAWGPIGRIAYAPSAGAVSSGNITIRITAYQRDIYNRAGVL